MLPDALDVPACFSQLPIGVKIPKMVLFEFVGPPFSVSLRERTVNWAAVPKTTVHKDGYFSFQEDDIGTSRTTENRAVDPESNTTGVKLVAERDFGRGVTA